MMPQQKGGHGRRCGICKALITAFTLYGLKLNTRRHFRRYHPEVEY